MTITDPHRWFAVRCIAGREKKIIDTISELAKREHLDLEPYMPAITRWRRIRASRKNVVREKFDRALFPGIVFIWGFPAHCGRISSEVEGVKFYTRRDGLGENVPAILPTAGIDAIRRLQAAGEFDETRQKAPDYTPALHDRAYIEDQGWVSQIGEIVKIKKSQGTATLIIDGRRVKAQLKTLRPEQKEEVAA
jgi:transcription antitermination factor NusG